MLEKNVRKICLSKNNTLDLSRFSQTKSKKFPMNHYQILKLNTYKLMTKEAKANPEVVSLIPAYAKGMNRLDVLTTEIDQLAAEQSKNLTGITVDKNVLLTDVEVYVVDVAGVLNAHAQMHGNNDLQAKVNFTQAALAKMQLAEVLSAAAVVLEEAAKLTPEELAEGGISAEEMTQFTSAFNELRDAANDPRAAIIDRTGYTQRLAELFTEAYELKKHTLDRLATQFARKAPEFYQKYQAAATVIYRSKAKAPATEVKA